MNIRYSTLFVLLTLLAAAVASSQTYLSFPGGQTDHATLRTQERVEELYISGAYERAYFIYSKDLAPIGDKYAQYMIGYMHFTGASVPEDHAIALAWYRLAAERGDPSISLARDKLQESLSPTQIGKAEGLFTELKTELGDRVLVLRLVKKDLDLLRSGVGRGPSKGNANVLVIDRRFGYVSGAHYNRQIKNRIEARLTFLKSQVEIIDVDGPEAMELLEIESEIKELIAEIDTAP